MQEGHHRYQSTYLVPPPYCFLISYGEHMQRERQRHQAHALAQTHTHLIPCKICHITWKMPIKYFDESCIIKS